MACNKVKRPHRRRAAEHCNVSSPRLPAMLVHFYCLKTSLDLVSHKNKHTGAYKSGSHNTFARCTLQFSQK